MRGLFSVNLALCRLRLEQRLSFNAKTFIFRSFSKRQIWSAVCLERKPVFTQELESFEKKHLDCVQKLEFEKSDVSDHEYIEDLKLAERLKKEWEESDLARNPTSQDFEDVCIKKLGAFDPASRVTKTDLDSNKRSLHRKLDQSLLLVVKQKVGNDYRWMLPQAIHLEGETLRQTADRAVREICASNAKIQILGNVPVGYYGYNYPKVVKRLNGFSGAEVFFFKAVLPSKNMCFEFLENNPNCNDYCWLLRSELKDFLTRYFHRNLDAFLRNEETEMERVKNVEKILMK